jgi:hypothetical protein
MRILGCCRWWGFRAAHDSRYAWQVAPRLLVALWLAAAGAACDGTTIHAVGAPGGVYVPGQGCTLAPGAPVCPGPGDAQPQLDFESASGDPGLALDPGTSTLSNLRVTCARSYCGTGSITAHAELVWNTDPNDPTRMGSFAHTFDPAVDLIDHTIAFNVYVDPLTAPMHAQVGVIFDYWRWVGWAPLAQGWNHIQGVVSPANALTGIAAGTTSIPVTSIRIDVYVPAGVDSALQGSWAGEIYLDDVSW